MKLRYIVAPVALVALAGCYEVPSAPVSPLVVQLSNGDSNDPCGSNGCVPPPPVVPVVDSNGCDSNGCPVFPPAPTPTTVVCDSDATHSNC